MIDINKLTYIYAYNTPLAFTAIRDITLKINKGEFIGIIGHTGSGKTTLIQHFNGLLRPTYGEVWVDKIPLHLPSPDIKKVREKIGFLFQNPEYQLFEETVFADIAFGLKNIGLNEVEIEKMVKDAMDLVGLPYEKYKGRSPFTLSGGEARRVAIAGILAMQPQVVILDEPLAGLDTAGQKNILQHIIRLHKELNITIIMVTHSVAELIEIAQRIIVMKEGTIVLDVHPQKLLSYSEQELDEMYIELPQLLRLIKRLQQTFPQIKTDAFTLEEAEKEIIKIIT